MRALVVLSLAATAFAGQLYNISPLTQCDGSTSIKHVEVENCQNSALCQLVRGNNHTVKVTLTAPKDAKTVKVLVTGLVADAELPFPGLNRYLCKEAVNSAFCPQKTGQEYTATINLPILSLFPKIKTTAFVRFVDDDAKTEAEEKLGCFQMQVELIDDPNAPPAEAQGTPPNRKDDSDDDE